MMRLSFLLSNLFLLQAYGEKDALDSENHVEGAAISKKDLETLHTMQEMHISKRDVDTLRTMRDMDISKRDVEILHSMRGMDADFMKELKDLVETNKALSSSDSTRLDRRSRGRRAAQRNGMRRLTTSRRLSGIERRLQDMAMVTDTMWLLICGVLVFIMHAGFAMLEAGTGRSKNTQAILIKNLITVCIGTIGWYLLGWSLAYGGDVKSAESPWKDGKWAECEEGVEGGISEDCPMGNGDGYADNGFIGGAHMFAGSGFLGKGTEADEAWAEGTIDPLTYGGGQAYMWFFQWAFCTAGASIVSGGVAERINFFSYMFFSFCMTSFIYPVVVCSTWGYGWLETFHKNKDGDPIAGYIDFAGSGVVHLCGGIAALVGAAVLGARKGRFDPAMAEEFNPHSAPLIVLGTFILWFGWCGFNPGSTLAMSDVGTALKAAVCMMNTTLSAATGGIVVFLVMFGITKKFDCAALCNGILAGLVSITAGCSNVESGSAVLIGLVGGFVVVGSSFLIKKLKIDDPVDAFSVHGACGIWGCIAAAVFDFGAGTDKHHGWGGFSVTSWTEPGETETKYMSTGDAFVANLCEVIFIIAWSGGLSLVIFGALRAAKVLRVTEAIETSGSDHECASPKAYNISGAKPDAPVA